MIPYMVGNLAPNSSHLTRRLVKYVPGRSYFRAVSSQNGDKVVTSPPPPPIVERVKTKPRIQRWMEFVSAYNFRLLYRRGQEKVNADFLSRLPLPPIEEDISGASALTDPDDLSVYLIRACGFITPSYLVSGVGLGGLDPSPYHTPGAGLGGLVPPPDTPVLGELPLTKDDF